MDPYNQFICGHDGDALEIRNDATSGTYQPSQWLIDWATGGKNDAGVAVNGYTALTNCSLWQGVNILAGDFGQTPVRVVKDKFVDQPKHPAWNLLRVSPNQLQTPSVWKETMMQWALIWGNGVSWIRRQGSKPVELIPLRPDFLWHRVMAFEDQEILLYHYTSPYPAHTGGATYTFFPWEVVHFQGLTSDGIWGYPLWQIAQNTIGHGLALEKHGNKQFSNGARPSGVLKHPGRLSEPSRENLRATWNAIHEGPDKAGKIAILGEGMEFQSISSTNVESDWLAAKQYTVYEVASLLNLPPHKLGAMGSTTFNNIEEQNAEYKITLNRWNNRADEEYRWKLLTNPEWKSDTFEFIHDVDAFLKGDLDTLTTIADRMVKATVLNPNEAREMIGYAPRKGGEMYGSPAINPNENSPSSAGKTPKPPAKEPNNVANAHKALLHDRILHLIERETNLLRQAAKGAKNFVEWLDQFYLGARSTFLAVSDSVMETSISASRSIGIHIEFTLPLENYAKHRHAVALDACSDVTKEQLPAAIEKLINSQNELVAQGLLATALGGESWD